MAKDKDKKIVDFEDPKLYINRELSWLQFNERVLSEAEDESNPLFERLKFLSIVSSNLDEFMMVRVGSLLDMIGAGYDKPAAGIPALAGVDRSHRKHRYGPRRGGRHT